MDEEIKAGGTEGEAFAGGMPEAYGGVMGGPAPENFTYAAVEPVPGAGAAGMPEAAQGAAGPAPEAYGGVTGGPAPENFTYAAGEPVPSAGGAAGTAGMPEAAPASGTSDGTAAVGSEAVACAAGEAAPAPSKGKNTKRKVLGCLEALAAMGLAAFGGWMFWQTRGTRLLYVDVAFGRICRYYWIALMGALVFFAVSLYTLRSAGKNAGKKSIKKSRKEVEKDGKLE